CSVSNYYVSRSPIVKRLRARERDDGVLHFIEQAVEEQVVGLYRDSTQFRIALDEFFQRHHRRRTPQRSIGPGQVLDRVAEVHHLPVEQCIDALAFVEQVAVAEIAVPDRDSIRQRLMFLEPDESADDHRMRLQPMLAE